MMTATFAGATIPHAADKMMRFKCRTYRQWFAASAQGYATFWEQTHRAPNPKASGDEGAWGTWAQHLPCLIADRAIAREEITPLLTAAFPLLFNEEEVANLPTLAQLTADFSLEHKGFLTPVCSGGTALVAGCIAALPLSFLYRYVLLALVVICLLMALVDAKCRIIPTEFAVVLALCGIVWQTASGWSYVAESVVGAGSILCLLLAINTCSLHLRKTRGIGGGDVRALPAAAIAAGFPGIVAGMTLSGIAFLAFALVAKATGHLTSTTKVPFGPFIALVAIGGVLATFI
ncbi:MAG: A24 family peptidase [Raoultibacter sp.]